MNDRNDGNDRNDTVSRRAVFGVGLGAAAAVAAGGGVAAATRLPDVPETGRARRARPGLWLRWWGNNSWEIRTRAADGTVKTVLIDPWLTRFHTGTYSKQGADPKTRVTVDTALLDRMIDSGELRADHILVTHGHYDHLPDVPYLAERTGATVVGTETHVNLMLAMGAPKDQLSIAVGGEYLSFDGYAIRVLRSLHSASAPRGKVAFAGTRPAVPPSPPEYIRDLVEGGTLAYEVITESGASVLNFGGSNYIEAELAGLRPDVVLLPAGGGMVPDYVGRLLRALGHPPYVVPTHWDDFDEPLFEPAKDWGGLQPLRDAVTSASSDSRFQVVDHLETLRT
ncbi:MBL fold metallo-hydrolase [Saccharomonospora xinjiangensis]|uniref:MBL fold metallo-hydrolase n=1 Tax=Saccharomonospora xinjiangensis TaxID=75294 RepID=UPI003510B24F